VGALDGDLLLVRPGAAEFALSTDQEAAGLGVDEQLGDLAGGKEAGIVLNDGDDIGGLAGDR
jgi:hypothetical protein